MFHRYLGRFTLLALAFIAGARADVDTVSMSSPALAALETARTGTEGRTALVHYQLLGDKLVRRQDATLRHVYGEAPRGDVSFDGAQNYVVVRQEPSVGTASLLSIESGRTSIWAQDVYPGSRPMSGVGSGVYVTRGLPGEHNTALTLSYFDIGGIRRDVFSDHALLLHLIANDQDTLIAYRVRETDASLLRIRLKDGALVQETPIQGFARDFSWDGAHVLLSNHSAKEDNLWQVQSWSPESGALRVLFSAPDESPIPFAATQGAVWTQREQAKPGEVGPIDVYTDESADGMWMTVTRSDDNSSDALSLVTSDHRRAWRIDPDDVHVESMGFVGGRTLR